MGFFFFFLLLLILILLLPRAIYIYSANVTYARPIILIYSHQFRRPFTVSLLLFFTRLLSFQRVSLFRHQLFYFILAAPLFFFAHFFCVFTFYYFYIFFFYMFSSVSSSYLSLMPFDWHTDIFFGSRRAHSHSIVN